MERFLLLGILVNFHFKIYVTQIWIFPLFLKFGLSKNSGKNRIYGRVRGTAREFISQEGVEQPIIKKQGNPYGTLTFDKFELIQRPTMVDYLRSGWIVSLSVAIDFTASNGELSE